MYSKKMKAVVSTEYGDPHVLLMKEVPTPVPGDGEVLIKVHASGVSSGDVHLRAADPFAVRLFFGLFKPKKKIPGYVLAGEIEAAGKDVKRFKKGDAVFGTTGMHFGAHAEYVCLPENGVLDIKPGNITWEEAAAIPFGGNTAIYFLRKANIQSGQKVLIYGASGALGTAAIQLAKYFGAEVTGVCSSQNTYMVKALGADKVIDYTKEDFANSGECYHVIFDTVGKSSFSACMRSLTKIGVLLLSAAGPAQMVKGLWTSITTNKKVISGVMKETAEDMAFFKEIIEAGKFRAVIDKSYPLEEIADAHKHVETGHKRGNVVITIDENTKLSNNYPRTAEREMMNN